MNRIINILSVFLPVTAGLIGLTQLAVSNSLSGRGIEYSSLEISISALRDENEILSAQLAQNTSLSTINKKAMLAGFTEPKLREVISVHQSVARR